MTHLPDPRPGLAVPFVLGLLALGAPAQEAAPTPTEHPFLWKIERDPPAWLFGTMHFPDERVLALHPSVTAALEAADAVYTELPLELEVMQRAQTATQLPSGQKLEDVLPEAVWERVQAWLKKRRKSAQMFSTSTPLGLATLLPMVDRLHEMIRRQPLDVVIYSRAKAAGKEVGGIEKVEEQIAVFQAFEIDEQVRMLESTLDELEAAESEGESLLEKIIDLYLAGDAEAFLELMREDAEDDPELTAKFEKLLLTDRNERMAERIDAMLREHPDRSFFFAVGAAHFAGEKGLVTLLEADGHAIERIGAPAPKAAGVEATLAAIHGAAQLYVQRKGRVQTFADLLEKDDSGAAWIDLGAIPRDPWGRLYRIEPREGRLKFAVISAGPDREFDTADDVAYAR